MSVRAVHSQRSMGRGINTQYSITYDRCQGDAKAQLIQDAITEGWNKVAQTFKERFCQQRDKTKRLNAFPLARWKTYR